MIRRIIYLLGIFTTLLLLTALTPSIVQSQTFSLDPAEVRINNLSPGEEVAFAFTIWNKDDTSHTFTLTTYNPDKSERREGRTVLPDSDWISFSPVMLELAAGSNAEINVLVAIPPEYKSTGKNWEIWLGVAPESSDLLTVQLYVRLLVSTRGNLNIGLIIGISLAVILVSYFVYYFRRRPGLTSSGGSQKTPGDNSSI